MPKRSEQPTPEDSSTVISSPTTSFVTRDGRVKILDFGLVLSDTSLPGTSLTEAKTTEPLTESGSILGTLGYMSPEQARGERVDARSEIFSLGCVFYEMAMGRPAFRRSSAAETLAAILREEPDLAALPPAVARLIERCLARIATTASSRHGISYSR